MDGRNLAPTFMTEPPNNEEAKLIAHSLVCNGVSNDGVSNDNSEGEKDKDMDMDMDMDMTMDHYHHDSENSEDSEDSEDTHNQDQDSDIEDSDNETNKRKEVTDTDTTKRNLSFNELTPSIVEGLMKSETPAPCCHTLNCVSSRCLVMYGLMCIASPTFSMHVHITHYFIAIIKSSR